MTDNDKALDKIIRTSMPFDFERKETLSDDKALVERLRDESIVGMPMENEAADRIEAQAAEIERLRESLEIWIFHHQRAMGEKPDVARQYAKAWMFRNANGEEPE